MAKGEVAFLDFSIFQVVIVSIVGPVLAGIGVLCVFFLPRIRLTAIVMNLISLSLFSLRFEFDAFPRYHLSLNYLLVLFSILALAADARLIRGFVRSRRQQGGWEKWRVEVESQNAWVVHKPLGSGGSYRVPGALLKSHRDYLGSDLGFHITGDRQADPVKGRYTVGDDGRVLLPADVEKGLRASGVVRFEVDG